MFKVCCQKKIAIIIRHANVLFKLYKTYRYNIDPKKVIRQSVTEKSRFLKQKSNTKSNEKVI